MTYSPLHPHQRRPRRLPLPLPIAKKSRATVQFASRNLSRKQRILSGAELRAEIICTKIASSSGQRAKPGKRFDACIGKTVLDVAERTDQLMLSQPYAMAARG